MLRTRMFLLAVWALVASMALAPVALGAATVESAFELGPPPSWQSPENGSWVKHSSPVVADLDPSRGNGVEIAVGSLDGKLYVMRPSGGQLSLLWSRDIGTIVDSSPAIADLDGDGFREVLVGAGNTDRKHASGVHVYAHDGGNHRYWATPDVPGYSNGVFSAPAIGNVTGDGRPEVVFGSFNHHMYVKDAQGRDAPGWEGGKFMHDTVWSSPSLADLNGDGDLEIVIGSDLGGGASVFGCPRSARGIVAIFEGDGSFLPRWPKCTDTPIWSSPAVADVTGDGILDVIVGTNNYTEGGGNVGESWVVRAWSSDGAALWSTPLQRGARVFSSPAVGDVTGDGRPEVAVATIEGFAGRVWLLDAASGRILWSRSDGGDDDCCIFMGSPILADVTGDDRADVVAAGGDGRLHAWDGGGGGAMNLGLGRTLFNSPAAADVDGDGRTELVAASAVAGSNPSRGKVWVVGTDGRGSAPWPMFRRTPDRLGSVGSGNLAGPAPPPPPPDPEETQDTRRTRAATRRPGTPTPTATATEVPTPTPDPTDTHRITRRRTAATGPTTDGDGNGSTSGVLRWAAAVGFLGALGTAAGMRRFGRF